MYFYLQGEIVEIIKFVCMTAIIVSLIWAPVKCSQNDNNAIIEMAKQGIDPVKAGCAISGRVCDRR